MIENPGINSSLFTKWVLTTGFFFCALITHLIIAQNQVVYKLVSEGASGFEVAQNVVFYNEEPDDFSRISNEEGLVRLEVGQRYQLIHPTLAVSAITPFSSSDTVLLVLENRQFESIPDSVSLELFEKVVGYRRYRSGRYKDISAESFRLSQTRIDRVPREIPYVSGRFFPGQSDTGIVYLSKVVSEFITFGLEQASERILSKVEAGKISKLGWRESADFLINPYQRFLFFSEISKRGYRSPFDDDYQSHYRLTNKGSTLVEGNRVYIYGIAPKRSFTSLFSGEIWIDSATSGLVYIDLKLTIDEQIELVDSLEIRQIYRPGVESLNHPIASFFTFHFDILGSFGRFETAQTYRNFQFLADNTLSTPIVVEDFDRQQEMDRYVLPYILSATQLNALHDDRRYRERWEAGEIADSLQQYYSDRPFQTLFIKGINLPFYDNRHYVRIYPLWFGTGFNTVEGFYTRLIQESNFDFEDQQLRNTLDFRLGFSDNRLKFRNVLEWKYDLYRPSRATLDFGNYVFQFNEANPILPLINSFYSIFLGRNYLRLYNKIYTKAGWERELFNGFTYNITVEYARRNSLINYSDPLNLSGASWSPFARNEFDRNNDVGSREQRIISREGFRAHNALTIDMDVTYQLFQRYKIIDGRKINLQSNYPKFYAQYKKGLPVLGAITDFDYLAVGMGSTSRLGNAGTTRFDISGGGFLNRNNVQFVDYKHFNGLQTIFLQRVQDRFSDIKQFRTMRYYNNSTDQFFIEAHFEHNFGGYLLSKVPYINRTKIHLVTGFNYLSSEFDSHFLELFFGFDNILKVGKIEFAGGWDDFRVFRLTMRVGVNFDYNFYRDNKRR